MEREERSEVDSEIKSIFEKKKDRNEVNEKTEDTSDADNETRKYFEKRREKWNRHWNRK